MPNIQRFQVLKIIHKKAKNIRKNPMPANLLLILLFFICSDAFPFPGNARPRIFKR